MASPPGARQKRRIQRALEGRDGKVCFYCGKELIFGSELGKVQPDTDERPIATIDHLKPLAKGGTNLLNNMILACRPCHNLRHG